MASDTTIRQVLALLATNYPEQVAKLSETELAMRRQLFVQALADIDDEMLKAAALRHISTSVWFPKVSELREAAARVTQQPALDPLEAWQSVRKAMLEYGSYGVPFYDEDANEWGYRSPVFDDPITNRIVKQLGWRELCLSRETEAMSDRARFLDAYARQAQAMREQQMIPAGLRDGAMAAPTNRQLTSGSADAKALLRGVAEKLGKERG